MVSLDELLNRGPVAVTFHRGHWCPYCRININSLAQAHKELTASLNNQTSKRVGRLCLVTSKTPPGTFRLTCGGGLADG
jgi:hypothetical protein